VINTGIEHLMCIQLVQKQLTVLISL